MKTLLNILIGITIGLLWAIIIVTLKVPPLMKDYQIKLDIDKVYLYNDGKLIGRCNYINTPLDSLITKDNQ